MKLTRSAGVAVVAVAVASALAAAPPAGGQQDPAPFFGFNEEWNNPGKLELAADAGADVSRAVVSWSEVERRRDRTRWGRYDALYDQMLEAGIRPLWVLADAPCWASSKRTKRCRKHRRIGRPPLRRHDDEWAEFAAEVAERYPESIAIQSWNEPNLVDFWKPRPNARRAAQITAAADDAVKDVDPDMPVLFGGLAPLYETIPAKREIAYDEFLRDAYDAVGAGHWDAVAMHPFPRFRNHDGYLGDIVDHIRRVRRALARSHARGTPIWVTEIGLTTDGPFPFTPRQQAKGLVRIYERLTSMSGIAAVVVHRLVDEPPGHRAESGWGVITNRGERKPAYCALAEARDRVCPPEEP